MSRCTVTVGGMEIPFEGTAATRVFLLLGHPVAHSLSPRFQGAALHALGLDAVYLPCDVAPEALPAAMASLRTAAAAGRLGGANVTLPHKSAVLPLLDDVDPQVRLAGACNSVIVAAAAPSQAAPRLLGYNTDVDGVLAVLESESVSVDGRPVVVLGSGGMARAASVAALRAGAAEVRVLSRSARRGRGMLEDLARGFGAAPARYRWAQMESVPSDYLDDAALLVQATSLGLDAHDPSPLSLQGAPAGLFVLETIYNPVTTAFLRAAQRARLRSSNGLGLLVAQGAAALRLWCSCEPPLQVMRRSVGLD